MESEHLQPRRVIDISSEMAEGFALPPCGLDLGVLQSLVLPDGQTRFHPRHVQARHDDVLLPYISSASLACGAHSGDAVVLQRLIPQLVKRGIHLGAHPSYPDIFRFGQHRIELEASELEAVVLFQLGALGAVLGRFGQRIRHVKCHGALQFGVSESRNVTQAVVAAIHAYDPDIILVVSAGTPGVSVARTLGAKVAEEAFLDRGYGTDGRIVPRDHPDALLTDPSAAAERAVRMVLHSEVTAVDGARIPLKADTYCIHSDTPDAEHLMAAIDTALRAHNVGRASLSEILANSTQTQRG